MVKTQKNNFHRLYIKLQLNGAIAAAAAAAAAAVFASFVHLALTLSLISCQLSHEFQDILLRIYPNKQTLLLITLLLCIC